MTVGPVANKSAGEHARAGRRVDVRGVVPLVVLLAAWQLAGNPRSFTFPPPGTWLNGMARLFRTSHLAAALGVTLYTFVVSLAIAVTLGFLIGAAVGSSQRVDRALSPIMDFFRALPPAVIVPVASLVLGLGLRSSIIVVAVAVVWPVLLNTSATMRGVPAVRLEMARSIGLSRRDRLFKIVLPSLMPGVIVGTRIAVSSALIVTLIVEIIGSGEGAGQLIFLAQESFDAQAGWALLLIVGLLGYGLNACLTLVEHRVMGYHARSLAGASVLP